MKWLKYILTLILIVKVTSAGTVVFEDGSQLMVSPLGPLPRVGEATVTYKNCPWWALGYCLEADIEQDGVIYPAVR